MSSIAPAAPAGGSVLVALVYHLIYRLPFAPDQCPAAGTGQHGGMNKGNAQ
jgi:hypothetical protein